MQAYIAASAGKSSQDRMKYALMRISPDLGHLRPYQITAQQCEAYAERRRRQGGGDGTIRRELGIMRAALRAADKHTPAVVKMPESPAPRDRHLTRKEFGRLLAAARSPHIRLFIILALSTGGRAGAILELTWDRIDIQRGRIMLAKEGQRGRKGRATVPMTNSAREALLGAQRAATTDHVIEYAGQPVASIKKSFQRAAERAGLHDVSPHVLRHTAAVWMIEGGASIEEVAQFLGHSDLKTTYRIYARYSPKHLARPAAALEI